MHLWSRGRRHAPAKRKSHIVGSNPTKCSNGGAIKCSFNFLGVNCSNDKRYFANQICKISKVGAIPASPTTYSCSEDTCYFVLDMKNHTIQISQLKLFYSVIGNTPDSESGKYRFEAY